MPVPIQSNHMQIYKHEYTRIIQITQSCYAILQLNIKISSLGLMIKHEQFNLNHSTTHIFSQKIYFCVTIPRNSKTLGFTVPTLNNSSVHLVNPQSTAIPGPMHTKQTFNAQINTNSTRTARTHTRLLQFLFQNLYQFGPKVWDRSDGP